MTVVDFRTLLWALLSAGAVAVSGGRIRNGAGESAPQCADLFDHDLLFHQTSDSRVRVAAGLQGRHVLFEAAARCKIARSAQPETVVRKAHRWRGVPSQCLPAGQDDRAGRRAIPGGIQSRHPRSVAESGRGTASAQRRTSRRWTGLLNASFVIRRANASELSCRHRPAPEQIGELPPAPGVAPASVDMTTRRTVRCR